MNYAYRFKNPDIETSLNVLCGKDYVQKAIREQYDNNNKTIDFEFQSDPGESGASGCIWVSKSEIERVRAYNPDAWNPYPAVKPSESGPYLITVKIKDQPDAKPFVTVGCLDPFGYWEKYTDSEVLAFRELPEAYEKEKEK